MLRRESLRGPSFIITNTLFVVDYLVIQYLLLPGLRVVRVKVL